MRPLHRTVNYKRRGFVVIAFTLSLALLLGSAGLTFDVGRMYITKSEAQSYCDAAALYAVWKLNGKRDGITAARAAALATPKKWDFGTKPFDPSRTTVEFAKAFAGPWDQNPNPAADYVYARVRTSVQLPMFLMPVVTGQFQATIGARATAKQLPITGTPNNIFPFAPFWMVTGGSNPEPPPSDPYGMIPARTGSNPETYDYQQGGIYTLRGPSNWKNVAEDMCQNDATPEQYGYRKASGIPDRGFIWDTKSMSDIRDAIQGNAVPQDGHSISIGDPVDDNCFFCMVEGTRQTAARAIQDRVASDSYATALNFQAYHDQGGDNVNSRRIVVVPVVTGVCGSYAGGTANCPTDPNSGAQFHANTVIGFASFFLLPVSNYQDNANAPLCGEYIGPWVPNSSTGGGAGGSGGTGGSVPTLVD
ncbi:MAG: Tad domain-containing protein [Acidobacteria bacterium]|nr:Tad domain-containing protein [Acidobacteriota bacterium]